ncbi:hypothetical protein BGL_1c31970 [Burkholderia plantarii]|uniref:Uncharacterized protein n=1 Tax=Burkholderia plantarii TaxID=41899 RepID=A0A0B6RQP5_BURPL|nr:hypothetical protein BGL_1c31970 [Burkholderia plantarii]
MVSRRATASPCHDKRGARRIEGVALPAFLLHEDGSDDEIGRERRAARAMITPVTPAIHEDPR